MNMLQSKYMTDLMLRMAHHSTAIEGNPFTQEEVNQILLNQSHPDVISDEYRSVLNYRYLMPYLMETASQPITSTIIRTIHRLLMTGLLDNAGRYKTIQNTIIGAAFTPVMPYEVPMAIQRWCDDLAYRLSHTDSPSEKVYAIMEQHIKFERIHPFSDGNGRTGRALMIYSYLHQNLLPIVIEKEQKQQYIDFLHTENAGGLCDMALALQGKEKERLKTMTDAELKAIERRHFPCYM